MINKLKRQILEIVYRSKEGHIPSAFSILDILWVLYDKIMGVNDKFVLSKGHGSLALYVVLAEKGIIPKEWLDDFATYDGSLGGHPDMNKIPGVECSTGSLGHGLPQAVGMALGKKIKKEDGCVFVVVGDGECNEGSIWESALLASHHELNNLVCLIDYNHSTDRALGLDYLGTKFQAFGWWVNDIDGHDRVWLENMISRISGGKPTCIICNTIKGKGVKRMEDNPEWHHKAPTETEYDEMIKELCE